MIAAILFGLQAAATVSPEARARYEPLRRCLDDQVGWAATSDRQGEDLVKDALMKCLGPNLATGSAELFAEMKTGATKEEAIRRGAAARTEAEQEFLAKVQSLKTKAGNSR